MHNVKQHFAVAAQAEQEQVEQEEAEVAEVVIAQEGVVVQQGVVWIRIQTVNHNSRLEVAHKVVFDI
jgi:hypothetical protein